MSELNGFINDWRDGEGAVLACSALKESYRTILAQSGAEIDWVYLKGDFETISKRMKSRKEHFMNSIMLQSQFDVLEEPTYGIHELINSDASTIAASILSHYHA